MIGSSSKKMLLCSAFSLPSRPHGGDLYSLLFFSLMINTDLRWNQKAPLFPDACLSGNRGALRGTTLQLHFPYGTARWTGNTESPYLHMEIGATFRGTTLHCTYRSVHNGDQPFLPTLFRRNTPEGHIALPHAPAHTARRLSSVIHEMLWKISVIVFAVLIVLIIWRFLSSVNPFFEIFFSNGCRTSVSAHQYRRAFLHRTSGA